MQTSFFILAGSTLCFTVNTFFLLPKRKSIPWPLPADYCIGSGSSGQSLDSHALEPSHVYSNSVTDTGDLHYSTKATAASQEQTSNTEIKTNDKGSYISMDIPELEIPYLHTMM